MTGRDGAIDAALSAKLAQLSPERRALLERKLRELSAASRPAADTIPRRSGTGPVELSAGQELLWSMDQAMPGLVAYNVPRVLRVRGALDTDALRTALESLVTRHEALRTRFVSTAEGPRQVVDAAPAVPFDVIDLRGRADAEADAEALVRERARRPFDLAADLMLRATVIQLAAADWIVVLLTHHIVCDEGSRDVTFRELGELYAAQVERRAASLPELPIQFADYAVWQRDAMAKGALAPSLSYWREQLRDLPRLELPTDRPPAAQPGDAGARNRYVLPLALLESLRELARANGVSLNMLLLAAYNVLLGRYSGQDDLVVGSPVSGRQRPELEGLIGYFPNTVVLRTRLHGDPTFATLLQRTRETSLAAIEHQDVPLEQLALELQAEGQLGNAPLFDAVFVMQSSSAAAKPLALGDADVSMVPIDLSTAKFDIGIVAAEATDGLRLTIEYRTGLFDSSTVDRFASHFQTILEQAVRDPQARVWSMPIMPDAERALVVQEFNDTAAPVPQPISLHGMIEAHAAARPDAVALSYGGKTMTYAELDRRATGVAAALQRAGVGHGVVVGLCVDRSFDYPVGILGVLKAGGAWLPLDPTYPADRLEFMLKDSGAPVLLTQQHLVGIIAPPATTLVFEDIEAAPVAEPGVVPAPETMAYVIYTSGSTGTPKGVILHHLGASVLAEACRIKFGVTSDDRFVQFPAISFDASVIELVMSLGNGASLHLAPRDTIMNPELLAQLIQAERATVGVIPVVMLRALDERLVPTLRTIVAGGEVCGIDVVKRWGPGRRLFNAYGPTEIHVASNAARGDEHSDTPPPIGGPLANYRNYVLDPKGQPVPVGVPGELWIGGPAVAHGYLNRPELNAERFVPDPFVTAPGARMYRSGDRARWRPDGQIEYLGRLDNQVKVNGYRIELGEIEAAMSRLPGVEQALVLVAEPRPNEKQLVAYWVGKEGGTSAAAMRAALRETLPVFMVPAAFIRLDALPLMASGKVDRRKLPSTADAPAAEQETVAPRNAVEEKLAALWCDVLRIPSVGVHDDFLALGGHSLLAIRVLGRVQGEFGVRVPLSAFFAEPTIEALARVIAQRGGAGDAQDDTEIPRRADRSRAPLSLVQERFWIGAQMEAEGDSVALNVHIALRLHDEPDVPRLSRAIDALLARHEALRTSIVTVDGVAEQRMATSLPTPLVVTDLRDEEPAAAVARAHRITNEEREHHFDLAVAPLMRARLVRLAHESILHLTFHHIVMDGWAMRLAVRDLSALYDGRPLEHPDAPDYGDFAAWQRERRDAMAGDVAFWRNTLAGAPPVLELPTDRPRASSRQGRGARSVIWMSPEVGARVHAEARASGATVFMTMLAGFQLLLGRLAGQDDVVVGAPVTGRARLEEERMVGVFINTLPLRVSLAGAPTFRELVERAKKTTVEAFAHQSLPFDRLVDELKPERSLGHTPVFQVLLNMVNLPEASDRGMGAALDPADDATTASKFDFTLYVSDRDAEGMRLAAVYDPALFDAARIEEMLRQFVALLDACTNSPNLAVTAHSLVTGQAAAVLPDPAAVLSAAWHGSVPALVTRHAAERPTQVAVRDAVGEWTYATLDAAAADIARQLSEAGVRRGAVVAIHAERAAALVPALVGVLRAGAAFMILDANYPAGRLADYVRVARPGAMLRVAMRPDADALPLELTRALEDVGVATVIDLPAAPETAYPSAVAPPAEVCADDLAYVAFTSGTTGLPKGIRGRHGSLTHFIPWRAQEFQLGPGDRFSMLSGLSHDPLHRDVFVALGVGATICVPDGRIVADAQRLAAWLRENEITVAHLTPAMTELLGGAAAGLSRLRWAFFVGDQLQRADVERLRAAAPNAGVVNQYGATESQQALGYYVVPPQLPVNGFSTLPVGRGVPDVQLLVLNDHGVRAGIGEVGEIAIRSPHIALGYIGTDGADRFVTSANGDAMYRTGDLGRYEPTGVVRVAGRADGQVKIRGFRVETGEIAAVLRAQPGVRDAVVVARDVASLGRALVAYVVPLDGVPSHGALLAALRERLPDYMIPSAFVALDAIPLTPNGKLDRKALPDPDVQQASAEAVLPEGDLETALLMLWRGALKRPAVGVTDSFFDAGGHSLLATQLVAKVGQVFRQTVPLRLLFESPRVRDFARALVAREPKPGITAQIARLVVKIDAQRTETSPARDERVGVTS